MDAPIIRTLKSTALSLYSPVVKVVSLPFEWAQQGQDYFSSWADARERSLKLAEDNESLRQHIAFLERLNEENETLRKFLRVRSSIGHPLQTVKVIAYPGRPYVKSILVNAGEKEDVKLHQVAVDHKGLVGHVITNGFGMARILLITDLNARVPVVLKGTNINAILTGANDQKPFLKYVQAKVAQEGQIVETSGRGGIFPPGIPVGRVSHIQGEKVLVEPFSNLDRLSFVMLVEPVIHEALTQLVDHEAFDYS